jgi:hypothetical protein
VGHHGGSPPHAPLGLSMSSLAAQRNTKRATFWVSYATQRQKYENMSNVLNYLCCNVRGIVQCLGLVGCASQRHYVRGRVRYRDLCCNVRGIAQCLGLVVLQNALCRGRVHYRDLCCNVRGNAQCLGLVVLHNALCKRTCVLS